MNTMEEKHLIKLSKRIAKVLRHDPGRIGLVLDSAGWVPVETFLQAMRISRNDLDEVVTTNTKQRFAIERGEDGVERIRANQGHSISVDLQLDPVSPPPSLYHGTTITAVESIRVTGLRRGARHHVHLSADTDTAYRVGARRAGRTVVITVDAAAMDRDGHLFYRSANGVWLTHSVPPIYLSLDC